MRKLVFHDIKALSGRFSYVPKFITKSCSALLSTTVHKISFSNNMELFSLFCFAFAFSLIVFYIYNVH